MRGVLVVPSLLVLAMTGCTNYVPVAHNGGNWEQARLAAYHQGAVPLASPAAATAQAPTPVPDWPQPQPSSAASSFDPRPLPPLRGGSPGELAHASGPAFDSPVIEAPRPTAPTSRTATRTAPAPAAPAPEASPPAASAPSPAVTTSPAAPEPAAPQVARAPARAPERTTPVETPAPAPTPETTTAAFDVDEALTPPSLSGVGFLWPVPTMTDPGVTAATTGEGGMVIDVAEGEPFVAAENGVVVFAADALEQFGNMVVVRHDGDYVTSYAHARELDVAVGDVVRRGQRLGVVGSSGSATAAQLYFEMRVGSRVVDPRAYLVGAPQLASR